MPNNDNDHKLVYDYHDGPDDHPVNHKHDHYPRHFHDHNGSIYYLDVDPADLDDGGAAAPALIGDTGYDITLRTPRSTRPAP